MKCLIYFSFCLLGKMFMAVYMKWVWTGGEKNIWQFRIQKNISVTICVVWVLEGLGKHT